ncbi:hypothetical protein PTSG_11119 [Salpingoeca rosetta]|uniref:Spindle and kinetochore-associated protein 3 n=1 Tax=Salpingoeca rosetta (strain ATCC 50818 / BSB-021) TaxID=946362 RepID=F2US72_SALR5|nr:uncharacterized protein PTSG_11119 [Salpingoeca rosetta]EGD80477.1 hypothetical protein PTSG_11119 [Salpingoeca rosetta]|eukprot:XP_004988041.1 hypothetical protein PTSG_11119 [Salpingoeca rosetta]
MAIVSFFSELPIEDTLVDLQTEAASLDDALAKLVAKQQTASPTRSLVSALHTIVQNNHEVLDTVESKLSKYGFAPADPLPSLDDLLLSCKDPEGDNQDNTFCIDSDTSQHASDSYTISADTWHDDDVFAQQAAKGCAADTPAHQGDSSVDGTVSGIASPAHTNNSSQEAGAYDGEAQGEVSSLSEPPQSPHTCAPEPPMPSPSPPMLSRTKIKLSATTMEALKRADSLSPPPAMQMTTGMTERDAKYRNSFDSDMSPLPMSTSLPRASSTTAHTSSASTDTHSSEKAVRDGDEHGVGEGSFTDHIARTCPSSSDKDAAHLDFGLGHLASFGSAHDEHAEQSTHHSTQAETPHATTATADTNPLDLSALSPPPFNMNSDFRAKYARTQPNNTTNMSSKDVCEEEQARADAAPTPVTEAEEVVHADSDGDDGDGVVDEYGDDRDVSTLPQAVEDNSGHASTHNTQETVSAGEPVDDTCQSVYADDMNDSLTAHVHEILRDLSSTEFSSLPSFVQAQVSVEELNEVILALRECLKNVGSVEVTLSESQLRDDLCLGSKTKACILALIKTGRMKSQGMADGTTVYGFVN